MGLVYHLHTTNVNVCSAKLIPTNLYRINPDDHLDELMNYFITTTGLQDLLITPQIYLHIQKGPKPNTKDSELDTLGIFHYKITLYSYKLTLKELKELVNRWTMDYRNYIKEKTKGSSFD